MALAVLISVFALVVVLTLRDRTLLGLGMALLAACAWLMSLIGIFWTMTRDGWTTEKAEWFSSAFLAWVILSSLGRPMLLLSRLFEGEPDIPQRMIRRSYIGQVILCAGIAILVIVGYG